MDSHERYQMTDIVFKEDMPSGPYFNLKVSTRLFGTDLSRLHILLSGQKPFRKTRQMPTFILPSINVPIRINQKWKEQRNRSEGIPLPPQFKTSASRPKVHFENPLDTASMYPASMTDYTAQSRVHDFIETQSTAMDVSDT